MDNKMDNEANIHNRVVIKNVEKSYSAVTVLNRISFEVKAGETIVICGPSGCGKTTLLKLIAGLDNLETGEIFINGKLVSAKNCLVEPHKRGIGFVFQSSALWPHMTIKQNILFGIKGLKKNEKNELVNSLMNSLDISQLSRRYPGEISGGQARRVAIGRALAAKPVLLLLDEPLTNLEIDLKSKVLKCILEYVDTEKASLIYVTHDTNEVNEIATKTQSKCAFKYLDES